MPSYPLVACANATQSGLAALATVGSYHGLPLSLEHLRVLTRDAGDDFSLTWLLIAARLLGFESVPLSGEYDQLHEVDRPNILLLKGAEGTRFVVLYEIETDAVVVGDPMRGCVERTPRAEFTGQWTGDCVSVVPRSADLLRARKQLERLASPWRRLAYALNPGEAGARKLALAIAFLAIALVLVNSASSLTLSSWIGLCALGAAALASLWLALFGQSCSSCSAAAGLTGVLPMDYLGTAFYTVAFVFATRTGREPILSLVLFCASGVHGTLLYLLTRERTACSGCIVAAAAAFIAAASFSVAAGGVGVFAIAGVLACAAATFAALPLSRQLAAMLGDREARRLGRSMAQGSIQTAGTVRVTVWKRPGCFYCLYYESILRPGLTGEFGDSISLEEREAVYRWVQTPLIVVSGAVTVVFKGLPPEDEAGDRYQALSRAVQAALNPEIAAVGQLGGLLIVERAE